MIIACEHYENDRQIPCPPMCPVQQRPRNARRPRIIPLEPHHAPGRDRTFTLILATFVILYAAGLTVIGLTGFGVIP